MFSRPTRSMLQALTELSRLPSWKEVDKLLVSELTDIQEKLLNARDDADMRRLQGRGKLLTELRELVATASETLAKTPR